MRAIFAILALFAASSASAQEVQQTPENAHRFLTLIAEQAEIRTDPLPSGLGVAYRVKMSSDDICRTQIGGDVIAYNRGRWIWPSEPGFDPREVAAILTRNGLTAPPWTIDWRRISAVTILSDNNWPNRLIHVTGAGGTRVFFMPDEATAKRVQYAMRFLKETCDSTAETGF